MVARAPWEVFISSFAVCHPLPNVVVRCGPNSLRNRRLSACYAKALSVGGLNVCSQIDLVNYLLLASNFFATLGCGLMAGLFFAFSNFVMRALCNLSPTKGIATMQSINVTALNPLFLTILRDILCLFDRDDFHGRAMARFG